MRTVLTALSVGLALGLGVTGGALAAEAPVGGAWTDCTVLSVAAFRENVLVTCAAAPGAGLQGAGVATGTPREFGIEVMSPPDRPGAAPGPVGQEQRAAPGHPVRQGLRRQSAGLPDGTLPSDRRGGAEIAGCRRGRGLTLASAGRTILINDKGWKSWPSGHSTSSSGAVHRRRRIGRTRPSRLTSGSGRPDRRHRPGSPAGAEEIDAAGRLVTPGFVDMFTPTMTARRPGTSACSPRPGTGSPPR
jgi:hypothetical protein